MSDRVIERAKINIDLCLSPKAAYVKIGRTKVHISVFVPIAQFFSEKDRIMFLVKRTNAICKAHVPCYTNSSIIEISIRIIPLRIHVT